MDLANKLQNSIILLHGILHGSFTDLHGLRCFRMLFLFPSRFLHGPAWYAVITKVVKPFDVFLISPSRIWPWTLHGPSRTAVSEASVFFAIFVSKKGFLGRVFENVFLVRFYLIWGKGVYCGRHVYIHEYTVCVDMHTCN